VPWVWLAANDVMVMSPTVHRPPATVKYFLQPQTPGSYLFPEPSQSGQVTCPLLSQRLHPLPAQNGHVLVPSPPQNAHCTNPPD
jgi:hypothetical protein